MTAQEDAQTRRKMLLEVARGDFQEVASQLADLEAKARAFFTGNALLISAGAFAFGKEPPREGLPFARWAIGILLIGLLLVLALSYRSLLRVMGIHVSRGGPDSRTTSQNYGNQPPEVLQDELTKSYSEAAGKNRESIQAVIGDLKSAIRFSKIGFGIFFLLSMIVVANQFSRGDPSMTSKESGGTTQGQGANDTSTSSSSGAGGSSSSSPGTPAANTTPPPPPPIQHTLLEKSAEPSSVRGTPKE